MNDLYLTKKVMHVLCIGYVLAGFLTSFAEQQIPKKQLPLLPTIVLKQVIKIKQIIESALSFENAIQNIQAFVGTDKERADLITVKKDEIIDHLLKRFNLKDNFQEAQSKLFELAKSGKGSELAIDALKKAGADLNQYDPENNTALIIATQGDHAEMVGWLIDLGADINRQNKSGFTALAIASLRGNKDVFDLIMKAQPNVNKPNDLGMTPLMQASIKGNKNFVKKLISEGADVNTKSNTGKTSLIIVSQLSRKGGIDPDREDVARQLIQAGAQVGIRDLQDKTALEYAKNERIKKILIDAAKEVSAKAIFQAIENIGQNQKELLLLEEQGAIQKQIDAKKLELKGRLNYFKSLAQKVTMNITDDQGNTPLHRAVQSGNENLVGLILIAQPKLIMKKNNLGQTPFELAIGLGREQIIELFKKLHRTNEGI